MASADGYQLILEANHVLATLAVEAINDGVVEPAETVQCRPSTDRTTLKFRRG